MRLRVFLGALAAALAASALTVPAASAAPGEPTSVGIDGASCDGTGPVWVGVPGADGTIVDGFMPDPDSTTVGMEVQWWPAADPTQVHDITGGGGTSGWRGFLDIPTGALADNGSYAFQLRGVDDTTGPGPWTPVCAFRTDFVPPTSAPLVSVTGYDLVAPGQPSTPMGGTGEPGTVTLDAHGDTQVTGFYYGDSFADLYVAADHPGGTATVSLIPELVGTQPFTAETADEARNTGPAVSHTYSVTDNRPQVSCTPNPVYLGATAHCTFAPAAGSTDVAAYTYWLVPDDEKVTVPAGPDGTATAAITPTDPADDDLTATATLTGGHQTEPVYAVLRVDPGAPTVDAPAWVSPGDVLHIPVEAVLPGSRTMTYRWDDNPAVTATLTFGSGEITIPTPAVGLHTLTVFTTTAAGQVSGTTSNYLTSTAS